jgi:hypothetical protein
VGRVVKVSDGGRRGLGRGTFGGLRLHSKQRCGKKCSGSDSNQKAQEEGEDEHERICAILAEQPIHSRSCHIGHVSAVPLQRGIMSFLTTVGLYSAYGMCINIVEVSWKAKLKLAFPDRTFFVSNLVYCN